MFKLLPFFSILLFSMVAEARDRAEQFSVGGSLGVATPSPFASDRFRALTGAGPKLTLFGRYHHASRYTGFEISGDYFRLSGQGVSSKSATLSLFWRGLPLKVWHPVFSVGFGIARMSKFFSAGDSDQPFHRLRLGVEWEAMPDLDIGFHLDHFSVLKDNVRDENLHVLAPSVSAILYFGTPPPALPMEARAPVPGATKDSDGDGVIDPMDRCAGTVAGAAVNAAGCAVKQSFEQQINIAFGTNVSAVASYNREAFAALAKVLNENEDMRAEIQGHTDSAGGAAKNRNLSQARAESVRKIFVNEFKVSEKQLLAKGYGSSLPVDTNNNPQGRSNNRRVVVKISR
jgi:outer membrane protein OmpA-like peptidoglycan-associated protein